MWPWSKRKEKNRKGKGAVRVGERVEQGPVVTVTSSILTAESRLYPSSAISDQLPREGIQISGMNVQKHGSQIIAGHGYPTSHTLRIQSNTDMASSAAHAPDNFSISSSETLNTLGPPPGDNKSSMEMEAGNAKIKSPDLPQFKPTKPTRKGTMQIKEMANAEMRRLLADIEDQARQKLDKQELEVLLAMADETGSSLATEWSIPDLVASVEVWKDSLEKKRGRMITFPWHGKTMNVTKLLDDTVGWIHRFREIGDVVVQYDPVHLGLPWAGIKFLTQVVVEDRDNIASISITLERVTNVTALSTAYVALLSHSESRNDASGQQLKTCLVQLHAAVLSFLASAIGYLKDHKKAAVKSLLKLSAFGEKLKIINEHMREVQEFREVISGQDAARHKLWEREQFEKLIAGLGEGLKVTESLVSDLNQQKKHDLLNWISTTPYIKHHKDAGDRVLKGTGNWLFEANDEFYSWNQSTSATSILWLQGDPGVGKTYLMHAAIEWQRQYSLVVHFYCSSRDNDNARRNPEDIMKCLLKALLIETGRNPQEDFPELFHRYQARIENGELSMDEACMFILQVLKLLEYPRVFIDALDEVERRDRPTLLKRLFSLMEQSNMKLWLSSRPEEDIKLMLEKQNSKLGSAGVMKTVLIEDKNTGDIKSYVEREVNTAIEDSQLLGGDVTDEFKNLIIQKLAEKAEGMFLWVRLQLLNVCDAHFPEDILSQLEDLPKGLELTYNAIYGMINREGLKSSMHAKNALRWVMCATGPLKLEEWIALVRLSSGDIPAGAKSSYLERICHNLVTVDRESGRVRFVHLSVREFLNQQPDFNTLRPDSMASRCCLQHLVALSTTEDLLPYVVENWPIHCLHAYEVWEAVEIPTLILDFFRDKEAFQRWLHRVDADDLDAHSIDSIDPLFVCARYGIPGISPLISQQPREFGIDKTHRNSKGGTPLHLAVKFAHSKVVEELLQSEEFCDINAQDADGRTPFALAVFLNEIEITRLLICNENVDVNIPDSPALRKFPPLVRAAWQENVSMVSLLLRECKSRLNLDAVNGKGETALHWAVRRSQDEIVRMLLTNGANLNIQSFDVQVPLVIVLNKLMTNPTPADTDRDIFSMLCKHPQVDFHKKNGLGFDISCQLIYNWQETWKVSGRETWPQARNFSSMLVDIVQANNYNVNALASLEGENPLRLAVWYRVVDAIHILLGAPDIDVNAISENQDGRTALHLVVCSSDPPPGIAEALLACESINIRATDDFGMTPLMYAVRDGHWGLAKLMLQREGVGNDALKEIEYNNEIVEACYIPNNHQAVLEILGVENPCVTELSPLISERQRRQGLVGEVIEAALEADPAEAKNKLEQLDFNICTSGGHTALSSLIHFGSAYSTAEKLRGYRALLDLKGFEINTVDFVRLRPIDYAVRYNDAALVGMLLARPELEIRPSSQDQVTLIQQEVLIQAVSEGYSDIFDLLAQDPRSDVNVIDYNGRSVCDCVLSIYDNDQRWQMFMSLFNSGRLNINQKNLNDGQTPLFVAILQNDERIVRFLLDCPDLNTLDEPDDDWDTPLGLAVKQGYCNIVRMLLKKGANLHWTNYKSQIPLDIAIEYERVEILELLNAAMK